MFEMKTQFTDIVRKLLVTFVNLTISYLGSVADAGAQYDHG